MTTHIGDRIRIQPGSKVKLSDHDTRATFGIERKEAERVHHDNVAKLRELQYRLFAESKRSVLVVLQGMDAAGKDGTIRKVFGGLNPQGIQVTGFARPTHRELSHDYLWRVHRALPARGMIGIFNRSHYEDILIVRVRDIVPKSQWSRRYEHINNFEQMLVDEGTTVLKFMLHVSPDEQLERLTARLQEPRKAWKFNEDDFEKRNHRPDYIEAYEHMLENCSTKQAPWFVVPADRKWFRNFTISSIVLDTLTKMDPQMPKLGLSPGEIENLLKAAR